MSQLYIENVFQLRNDNGVLLATNGIVSAITGTSLQYIDGTGSAKVLNTSIVPELTNLYFTTARAQAAISGSAPISVSSGVVSITQSNSTTNGYLSSTDWNTFNSKQQGLNGTGFVKISGTTISYDNSTYYLASNPSNYISLLALSASLPLSYNNTTGVFSISQSNSTTNGYLSSTDWNIFNNKQSALGYTPVPNTRNLTINGTTYDLSADRTWTISFPVTSVFGRTGSVVAQSGDYTTTLVTEGTNLYFTNARAIGALLTGYTSGSGTISSSDSILSAIQKLNGNVGLLTGAIIYQGTWNASTNTPTIISGVGIKGYMYKVSVAGTTTIDGVSQWNIGDQLVFNGTVWDKIDGIANEVLSVFGRVGAVVAASGDYNTSQVTENTNLYYTDARARAAISLTTTGTSGVSTYNSSTGVLNIPNYGSVLTGYVPYTGATSDVDLGTHKLSLNSEQFASISAPSYSEGALWYDSTQKALAYYNDISGNVLHIGQEVQLKVHNNTGSTIAKGAPVYVTSTSSGGSSPNVALAKADTATTSNVIGLANQAIPTGTDGYITLSGLLTGVSTGAFTVGDILYLSPYSAGQLMNTLPPTGYAIKVGVVSYSNSPNGTIYINQSHAYSTAGSIVGTIAISQGGTGATTAAGALSNLGGIGLTSLSASAPLSYNNTTGAFSISQATTSTNGYLSSTDWNTFNNKQNALTNPITGTGTSGQVAYFNGTSAITGSNNLKFDGTNLTVGNPSSVLANLHVYNASAAASFLLQTNSTTDYSEIAVRNNSSTATSYFRQYSTAATGSDFGISRAGLALFFSNYATNFAIGTRNGGNLIFGTADTERARFLASNGYFGINTTTPGCELDVNGNGYFSGNLLVNGTFYVSKSSTSAVAVIGNNGSGRIIEFNNIGALVSYITNAGDVYGSSFIKSGGSAVQFLKADGSVDSNTYLTSSSLSDYVTLSTNQTITGTKTFNTAIALNNALNLTFNASVNAFGNSFVLYANKISNYSILSFYDGDTYKSSKFYFDNTADRTYTFPNTSGTLALSSDLSSYVPTTRTISTTAPLQGGGDLSANRTLSITQATTSTNGYLSSTDWNTFNSKQNALTNPVTGTGTTNYLPKFTGTSTIGNSLVYDNGTQVGIDTATNTTYKLQVNGTFATSQLWQLADNSAEMKIGRYNSSFPNAYIDAIGPSGDVGFQFRTQIAGAGGGTKMTITAAGNVGIGTSSPATEAGYTVLSINNATYGGLLDFSNNNTLQARIGSDAGAMYIQTKTSIPMQFYTANTERMRITSGGNVGIGTTTANQKLTVSGDVNMYNYTSFTTSTKTAASGSSATFVMSTDYGLNVGGDNIGGLVVININEAATSINLGNAAYVGIVINPRGSGGSITQISKVQGGGITALSVSMSGNSIVVNATTGNSNNFRASLTFIGGGGTS